MRPRDRRAAVCATLLSALAHTHGLRVGAPPRASAAAAVPAPAAVARTNPRSDLFTVRGFHHVEFYCADATSAAGRFSHGLGMNEVARSDGSTGNGRFTSVCLGSGDVRFVFTAPASSTAGGGGGGGGEAQEPRPAGALAEALEYDADAARAFLGTHGGLAVRAVCLRVDNVRAAFKACVAGGAAPVLTARRLEGLEGEAAGGEVAEVALYGDVVLRLLSLDESHAGSHLPGYAEAARGAAAAAAPTYGIRRIDHVVGNVWEMGPTVERLKAMLGFHEFAEFTAADVGTIDSGLNSMVLASNDEMVLLPVNEPTYGTRRRSQIETYLLANGGEGVQHMALKTDDIFVTVAAMRAAGARGGFAFMDAPSDAYYDELPARIGDALGAPELARARELGLLVDRDDQGVLIQVFTRPVGDRPTLFLELIQRVGCLVADEQRPGELVQRGGCGGFGKGNFKELFKSVEDFERTLEQ